MKKKVNFGLSAEKDPETESDSARTQISVILQRPIRTVVKLSESLDSPLKPFRESALLRTFGKLALKPRVSAPKRPQLLQRGSTRGYRYF